MIQMFIVTIMTMNKVVMAVVVHMLVVRMVVVIIRDKEYTDRKY